MKLPFKYYPWDPTLKEIVYGRILSIDECIVKVHLLHYDIVAEYIMKESSYKRYKKLMKFIIVGKELPFEISEIGETILLYFDLNDAIKDNIDLEELNYSKHTVSLVNTLCHVIEREDFFEVWKEVMYPVLTEHNKELDLDDCQFKKYNKQFRDIINKSNSKNEKIIEEKIKIISFKGVDHIKEIFGKYDNLTILYLATPYYIVRPNSCTEEEFYSSVTKLQKEFES